MLIEGLYKLPCYKKVVVIKKAVVKRETENTGSRPGEFDDNFVIQN